MIDPNDEFPELDALVIAPHPDDAELGMGGAILKMLAAGKKIGVLDLTNGEPTPFGSIEIRADETAAATKSAGVELARKFGITQSKSGSDTRCPREIGGRDSIDASSLVVRAVLD